MRGIEQAHAFYEQYGRDMIEGEFPQYADKIAVGLAGHGSECYGYDDQLSRDHDFKTGFCLWIDEKTEEEIGIPLRRAYRALPGNKAEQSSAMGRSPVGVCTIGDFYRPYTGSGGAPESWQQWLYLPSHALAEATNGQVWRDDSGVFTGIRERLLHGMPEDVRKKKLAARLVSMAQSGQYNYDRCRKHGEKGAAMLALDEFVRSACEGIFLLNRRHMPYYKWAFRAMSELDKLGDMKDALEFLLLGDNDPEGSRLKAQVVEDVCGCVVRELKAQGLTCGSWDYLEPHAIDLMGHIENPEIRALHVMEG